MAPNATHKPRIGSIGTNASGLSNISNAASLSQFPEPPNSIPSISLRLDPNAPYSNPSTPRQGSPITPTRSHPGAPFASGPSTPRRQQSQLAYDNGQYPFASNFSTSNRSRDFAYNNYEPATPKGSVGPLRRKHHTPDRGTPTSSRGPGYESTSGSFADDDDDRMPSTSFITGVLSSADHSSRTHAATDRDQSSRLIPDSMSAVSEMTYPPPAGAFRTPPSFNLASRASPSNASNKPPSTFLTMDDDQSNIGSTISYDSYADGAQSVIRTASTSRKLEPRGLGAAVVGYASGTIKRVASTRKFPESPANRERRREFRSSSLIPDGDEQDAQRMTLPDFHTGPDTPYSPARRSSIGFRPEDPLHDAPFAPPRRSKSVSFFSTLGFSGWFAPKPPPRITPFRHMTQADAAAFKEQENGLPLPMLVSRAGALEGMLAEGRRPHHSISTYASGGGHGRLVISPWDSKYREDMAGGATYVSSHIPTTPGPWPGPPNGGAPNPPRSMRKRKVIFGIIVLLIVIVVSVGVGVGLPKRHSKGTCPTGLAGNS